MPRSEDRYQKTDSMSPAKSPNTRTESITVSGQDLATTGGRHVIGKWHILDMHHRGHWWARIPLQPVAHETTCIGVSLQVIHSCACIAWPFQ